MGYGDVIRKIRKDRDLSLRDFEKLVDVDYSHLSRLEKEQSNKGKERLNPSIDILKQICDRTGYPFRQFLEEAGYIEPIEMPAPSLIQEMYDRMTIPQQDMLMRLADALLDNSENTNFVESLSHIFTFNRES
jgi:transcriptional regulator with XRE-family HTH domain